MSANWGEDIWDRFNAAWKAVNDSTDELKNNYKSFLSERSKIELDYAKNLKKLCKNYQPKVPKKKQSNNEEPTIVKSYSEILQQLNYQANQHELIAENLNDQVKEFDSRINEVKKNLRTCKNDARAYEINLDKSLKTLDEAKKKYLKTHNEQEQAKLTFDNAEEDGSYSRNDISNLKTTFLNKTRANDDCKAQYANQLGKTNTVQKEYYDINLASVLQILQNLYEGNSNFWSSQMEKCVQFEIGVAPIIAKCHDSMVSAIKDVNSEKDSQIVMTNLKTGNVPPEDLPFEELDSGIQNESAFKRGNFYKSRTNLNVNGQNLYQRKRELEKKLEDKRTEIKKVTKEVNSLKLMVDTYSKNPGFGDASKLTGELNTTNEKLNQLHGEEQQLQQELSRVTNNLEDKSPGLRRSNLNRSQISLSSNMSKKSHDSGSTSYVDHSEFDDFGDEIYEEVTPASQEPGPAPPPPPPPPNMVITPAKKVAVAIYDFDGNETEETLSIESGEELEIIEDDFDGWTKVKKLSNGEEGFVPSAYIEL